MRSDSMDSQMDYQRGYDDGFRDGMNEAKRIVFGYFDRIDKEREDEAKGLAKG